MNFKENSTVVSGSQWDGRLYETGNKEKIMIVFSGSDGGLQHACKAAKYLVDHEIPALALGYFKTKHTGKSLDRIPVELIKGAAGFLRNLGYHRIGIEGVSKGAELAFAAAIAFPDFFTIIVKTPSWFYSEGLVHGQPSGHSCWTLNNSEVPYTAYKERRFHTIKMLWKAKEFNILPVNTGKEVSEASIIPVEKIKAPILMFSTKADTVWPSEESCVRITERLQQNHFQYRYQHISYDHMSHMMLEYCGKEVKYFFKSEKEDSAACYKERDDMGMAAVNWIKEC